MRAFFQQTLKLMGADVRALHRDVLQVRSPENSAAKALLGGASENHLAFTAEHSNGQTTLIAPGSSILENTVCALAQKGYARHGVLPVFYNYSKKELRSKYSVIAGSCEKFACKREWETLLRLWVKVILAGDEVVEIIEGFEITDKGQIQRIDDDVSPGIDIRWIEKPPLKFYEFKEQIEAGMAFARSFSVERAEELQTKNFKRLYSTLEKLRIYYHQLNAEEVHSGGDENKAAIEAEYQRRKHDEIQYARIKATTKLIAVETISTPVQQLRWQLGRNGDRQWLEATVNLYNGDIASPARCGICQKETWSIGLFCSNILVCPTCCLTCDFCGDEVMGKQVSTNRICSICRKGVCNEHGLHCERCGELVCENHQVKCEMGCRVCPNCIQTCSECRKIKNWCKNHTIVNKNGHVSCFGHAVVCVGCRDHYPMLKTEACDACGQTVCLTCRESCRTCSKIFCLNHIKNGECEKCQKNNAQINLF